MAVFVCPLCGVRGETDQDFQGKRVKCPSCGGKTTMPPAGATILAMPYPPEPASVMQAIPPPIPAGAVLDVAGREIEHARASLPAARGRRLRLPRSVAVRVLIGLGVGTGIAAGVAVPAALYIGAANANAREQSEARKAKIIEKFVGEEILSAMRQDAEVADVRVNSSKAKRIVDERMRPGIWDVSSIVTTRTTSTPEAKSTVSQSSWTARILFDSKAKCTICLMESITVRTGLKARLHFDEWEWTKEFRSKVADAWLAKLKTLPISLSESVRRSKLEDFAKEICGRFNLAMRELGEIVGKVD